MTDNNQCGHKLCTCPVTGDDSYCSDHCRKATDQKIDEIACDCGHTSC